MYVVGHSINQSQLPDLNSVTDTRYRQMVRIHMAETVLGRWCRGEIEPLSDSFVRELIDQTKAKLAARFVQVKFLSSKSSAARLTPSSRLKSWAFSLTSCKRTSNAADRDP